MYQPAPTRVMPQSFAARSLVHTANQSVLPYSETATFSYLLDYPTTVNNNFLVEDAFSAEVVGGVPRVGLGHDGGSSDATVVVWFGNSVNYGLKFAEYPGSGGFNVATSAAVLLWGSIYPGFAATTFSHLTFQNVTLNAGATLATQHAIYIPDLSGATNNYSIYTGNGKLRFGGTASFEAATTFNGAVSFNAGVTFSTVDMSFAGALYAYYSTGNVAFGDAGSFGGGTDVVFISSATTIPTSNPVGGGLMYVDGGALKFRSAGGTITTMAPF